MKTAWNVFLATAALGVLLIGLLALPVLFILFILALIWYSIYLGLTAHQRQKARRTHGKKSTLSK